MSHFVTGLVRFRRPRRLDERGAIAIIMALSMLSLVIASAMVVDIGLVRVDRQVDQSAADSATLAGIASLGGGSPNSHPYAGVCAAIHYLQQNDPRFAGVTDTSGNWTQGDGTTVIAGAAGCANSTLLKQTCDPTKTPIQTQYVRFTWTGTYQDEPLQVTIQSGYELTGSGWPDESLPAVSADENDTAQGCDQLAVIVTQNRKPGLGSLATASDLVSSIRSVGRVYQGPGGDAPAMLLLKRTGCPVLQTGSNSGGSHIYVLGALSTDGRSHAGTIHSDSDGSGCTGGSNQNIFNGKAANGIVAFAGPLAASPALPDPTKPGVISSVAAALGKTGGVLRDSNDNVCGSTLLGAPSMPSNPCAAPRNDVSGRQLVTRTPIDQRYLAGVQGIVTAAVPFWSLSGSPPGYTVVTGSTACKAASFSAAAQAATSLFVNCASFTGAGTTSASTVVFAGSVNPSGPLALTNARKVYIFGAAGGDAISLGGGGGTSAFSVNSASNTAGTPAMCSNAQAAGGATGTDKAVVVVKSGDIKQTGGTLQMCYTTLVMMGSGSNACLTKVPSEEAPGPTGGPTSAPCTGSNPKGDGQLSQTGGNVDWTAPNNLDVTTDLSGTPLPAALTGWADVNGPEDLAFWSESYGGSSSPTYNMNGGGVFHVVGVYMVPNADPFTIGGGATQTLSNAQYVASTIALNGTNTSITMQVDANAAVTLPKLDVIGLVR